jgi:hypothetical protein
LGGLSLVFFNVFNIVFSFESVNVQIYRLRNKETHKTNTITIQTFTTTTQSKQDEKFRS